MALASALGMDLVQAQIPSSLGWYQIPNTSIASLCPAYPDIHANEGCSAIMADWSGGMFDTKRNRLIIRGGGHDGYYGNEIYAIDLNASPIAAVLVKDASHGTAISNLSTCPDAFSDGNPNAEHTYNGEAYVANLDLYFHNGAGNSPCGNFSNAQWLFNPSTLAWTQKPQTATHPNPAQNGSVPQFAYDPTTGKIFEVESNAGVFWSYDPGANVWTSLANVQACGALNATTAIDNGRRIYFCVGNGTFNSVSLNPPYTAKALAGIGCSTLKAATGPGFAYDPVQKLLVGWAGGNTVYLYNPDTDSCATQTYSGGPTTIQANGTYGRFQYSPASGVFVVANDINSNAYALRLTNGTADTTPPSVPTGLSAGAVSSSQINLAWTASTDNIGVTGYKIFRGGSQIATTAGTSYSDTGLAASTAYSYTVSAYDAAGNNSAQSSAVSAITLPSGGSITPEQDFTNRCKAPGVIACEGFDDPAEFVPATSPNTGLYSNSGSADIVIVQDTAIKSSGFGSLHFPIKANAGTNPTVLDNNWLQTFCGAHPPAACMPTVFQENSDFYVQFRYRVDSNYVNTDWELTQNGGSSPKIADIANHSSSCGQTELTLNNRGGTAMPMMYGACGGYGMYVQTGTTLENQNTPYNWQSDYYNCEYPQTPHGPGGCFTMPANIWMTFYEHVHIGNYNQANSVMETWVSTAVTDSLKYLIHITNFTMPPPDGGSITGYDAIWFNVYMTNFNPAATNPAANVWLDEVIVSTQPIAAPGGSAPPSNTTPPTVALTSPANGATVSGTITIAGTAADNVSVASVQVSVDGGPFSAASGTANWTFSLNTASLTNASHAISAKATGTSGNVSAVASVTVTVNNSALPPTISIAPLSTTTVSGTVTLTASASSNLGIASVQFQLDGNNLGSPLTAPPFTLSWNTMQAAPGTHSLTAVATDTSGNKTTAAPITVTVVRGAGATPGLRQALVYPNPAVKTDPTIRAFLGMVGSVEITIFDASGRVVHSSTLAGAPTGISNGQYYYDYRWTGSKSSGMYFAVIHGKAADGSIIRARVKFIVVN